VRSPQSIVALKGHPRKFLSCFGKGVGGNPFVQAALSVAGEFAVAPVLARNDFLADLRSLLSSYSTIITRRVS
jgi:hypothetical protein